MEFGTFLLGALVGYAIAMVFDWWYYKPSATFTKELDKAQDRIDALHAELASLRQAQAEQHAEPIRFLEMQTETARAEADHARIEELERLLEDLRRESTEAERRARLFEARLIDASSELASLRYGLPTLDRKAEDELQEIPRA